MMDFSPSSFFQLTGEAESLFDSQIETIFSIIPKIAGLVDRLTDGQRRIAGKIFDGAFVADGPIVIESGAVVEPGACIFGPAYIGNGVTIRQGAYVRENCVFLAGSTLGHASEAKNSLFMQDAKAPHFAYVGDSVLGSHVNLGAGVKLSNVEILSSGRNIVIPDGRGSLIDTKVRKFGAVLGDNVQIGCNAVLNPGVVLGSSTMVYPNLVVKKGVYGSGQILKLRQEQELGTWRELDLGQ